jgi:polysaccharide biosynthesis protein PslH
MRIAWVSPYVPEPTDSGGRIRIARLAAALAASNELHLYARICADDFAWLDTVEAKPFAPWSSVNLRRWVPVSRSRLWEPPEWVRQFPRAIGRLIAEHHRARPFDALVVTHCYAAYALPELSNVKLVLEEQNIESDCRRREARARMRKLRNALDFWRWRRWERSVWRKADAIALVSDADAAEVRKVRPDAASVIPNGIDLAKYRYTPPSERRGAKVLFLGSLSYEPNRHAAIMLATRVLPLLRKLVPDATLTLAGRDPAPEVRALASPTVRVPGTLDHVAPLFDEHAAFAMPLMIGGGSSLKALEPLATGLPLIATHFAMRGFPVVAGQHYVSAEKPEPMARALARAIRERASFDGMARQGRSIAERYAWDDVGARFAELVAGAVSRRRR